MGKRIEYAEEMLTKLQSLLANVIASGECTSQDRENMHKTTEALKFVRKAKKSAK